MPEEAFRVHGLSNAFLADKPVFARVVNEFLDFIGDADLVIHNAVFDMGFINASWKPWVGRQSLRNELHRYLGLGAKKIPGRARQPGCPLPSLSDRQFQPDASRRALLDAELLTEVYLELKVAANGTRPDQGSETDFSRKTIETASSPADQRIGNPDPTRRRKRNKPRTRTSWKASIILFGCNHRKSDHKKLVFLIEKKRYDIKRDKNACSRMFDRFNDHSVAICPIDETFGGYDSPWMVVGFLALLPAWRRRG